MAILDIQNEFSDAQAVTASAASTNVIDLSSAKQLGAGGVPIYLEVRVNTTTDSTNDTATIDIALEGSNTEGSGYVQLLQSDQFTIAQSTAGTVLMRAPLPANATAYRYLRVYYTIGTQNLTAGKFDAFLTTGPNMVS